MRTLAILLLTTITATAGIKGVNVDRVIRYWYSAEHSVTVPDDRDALWTQIDNGNGVEIRWKDATHAQPSEAWITDPANIAAADAWYAAQQVAEGTSGEAFVQIKTRLTASGYDTTGLNAPQDLIGKLPSIMAHIQSLIDAKDIEIDVAATLAEYKLKRKQRDTLTDGYNQIQSWAIAFLLRKASGK